MGRSLDLTGPPPISLTPLSQDPDRTICSSFTLRHRTRFLRLLNAFLLLLVLSATTSARGALAAPAGGGVASAALLLTAFASNIDPSWQLTCYTCVNVTDNQVCNRFAIDRPCPEDKQFCHSLHVLEGFGSKGDSLLVNKGCAGDDECNRKSIGCRREGGQTTCNACCDYEYCNEKAPVDAETATFVQTKSFAFGSPVLSGFTVSLSALSVIACLLQENIRELIAET